MCPKPGGGWRRGLEKNRDVAGGDAGGMAEESLVRKSSLAVRSTSELTASVVTGTTNRALNVFGGVTAPDLVDRREMEEKEAEALAAALEAEQSPSGRVSGHGSTGGGSQWGGGAMIGSHMAHG